MNLLSGKSLLMFLNYLKKFTRGEANFLIYILKNISDMKICTKCKEGKKYGGFDKKKESETIKLLGYSALQLKEHIESLFIEGMSWGNHGEWHIDHIKMVSDFDSETPMCIVNSLDNLRPLWATSRTVDGVFYEGNLNRKNIIKND